MERICCIFGAGDYGAMPRPELDDRCFLIAADGGYDQLKQWGISPHLAVGTSTPWAGCRRTWRWSGIR